MEQLFEILNNAQKASQIAFDLVGRINQATLGIVVNNQDPENKRRIKVSLPSSPQVQSDWLRRLSTSPNIDAPLPAIGMTVLVLFAEGVETNGYYLSLINQTNPPRDKESAQDDYSEAIPGNKVVEVGGNLDEVISGDTTQSTSGNEEHRTDGNILIECGQAITLRTDSGASITLSSAGYVEIKDVLGRRIRLGGVGGVNNQWDLAGYPLTVINATSFTINGKEVATVDATTNEGDVITNRGW
ncbi:hypothetical protein NIES22_50900 [Calothrix brevissima NIES-22]|nr:hypothetical protein NIES22_50900 [Calothrix brevissima NIES-22]